MLEQMRRSSQSLLIYLLFGIVIAVFIVNFGPQSAGGCQAPTVDASLAAEVEGRAISANDFRYGYLLIGGGQASPEMARQRRLKESLMDKLIERELLAREAARLGFVVSDEEVEDLIAQSKIVMLGYEQTLPAIQKDGKFDYEAFRRFVQYQLGLSPRSFIEQQRREMMALRMRDVLRQGVHVSTDEVKTDFERRGNQVNIEFVRFPVARHEADIEVSPAEIEAYAKEKEAALKKLYDDRKFLYEKAPKERKLRQLLVKVDGGASADAEEAARKKAEVLAARIRKGESFAAVARAASDDAATQRRGGAVGWKRQGTTVLGAAVEEKAWAAADGELVGPIKGPDGFYLVVAEETREGDIPFEKVRLDLAEDQLRKDKAQARAEAAAEAALAEAKTASGKTLKEVFPAPTEAPADSARKRKSPPPAERPQADETGLFMRQGAMVPVLGVSPELVAAAFDLKDEAPFAGPLEVGGSYVVVKLKERKTPDLVEFDKKKHELMREAALIKGEEVVVEWALRRCQESKEAGKLDVNKDLLRYEAGPEGAVTYEACAPPMRF